MTKPGVRPILKNHEKHDFFLKFSDIDFFPKFELSDGCHAILRQNKFEFQEKK